MRFFILIILAFLSHSRLLAQAPVVSFTTGSGTLKIYIGDVEVTNYVYQDAKITRPYFAHVRTLSGQQVTRKHPPRPGIDAVDHESMHLGIWLSFGDLNGCDYWRLKAKTEHIRLIEPATGGAGVGHFAVRNQYRTTDGQGVVCEETCRHTITTVPSGYRIDYASEFTPIGADLIFGDQEEMGLGIRLATPLAVDKKLGGRILDSAGRINGNEVWGKTANWCDYSGVLDSKWVGLTVLSGPNNFRTSWSHARDYGFLAMNPFGQQTFTKQAADRVVVKQGDTLKLDYAVVVHETMTDADYDPAIAYVAYSQTNSFHANADELEPKLGKKGTLLLDEKFEQSAVWELQ